MINNIVYISAAKEGFSRLDLRALLEKSRSRNAKKGITGLLMYNDKQFFQVLEGPEESINNCYETICADKRHSSVITLHRGTSEERLFNDWSMALVEVNDLDAGSKNDFINLCELHDHKTANELRRDPVIAVFAKNFLNSFAKFNK